MKKKVKILIVDDDSGIGEMLKMLLEMNDYEVFFSEKPEKTVANIKENEIDLVLLDMLISGVNGTDVCAQLRENETTEKIPVLMMSALHDAGEKCKAAGANGFVSKPFETEDLLAEIEEILSQNQ